MDNKKYIIIGIIILIIVAGVIFVMLTSTKYERVFITPNGTNIEVPAEQTKYRGDFESVKIWNWNNGILVSYNSNEDKNIVKVTQTGFNTLSDLIKEGQKEDIDGFTAYVINADDLFEIKLFDIIKINHNGKFYCIQLSNDTTADNIIIISKDRDMAAHMAKSVVYKKVFQDKDKLNDTVSKVKNVTDDTASKVKNVTDDLESKANGYINKENINKTKSVLEDKAGDIMSKSPIKI